jgi:hypothetical protein
MLPVGLLATSLKHINFWPNHQTQTVLVQIRNKTANPATSCDVCMQRAVSWSVTASTSWSAVDAATPSASDAPPHSVAAHLEIERKIQAELKAVHHISVSSTCFQALSTWVSSGQPAPPYHGMKRVRVTLSSGRRGGAAKCTSAA